MGDEESLQLLEQQRLLASYTPTVSRPKCADLVLQLDVDLLILEHLLFQAIDSHLQYFQLSSTRPFPVREADTQRTTSVFDSFIQRFNLQHPDYQHDANFNFQLDTLEFLVLLFGLASDTAMYAFSPSMLRQLEERVRNDLQARREWIEARRRDRRRRGKQRAATEQDDIHVRVEEETFAAWEKHVDSPQPVSHGQLLNGLLVFSLPSRFMTISAKFMDAIDQHTNEYWMKVSLGLMLRAALESLRLQSRGCSIESLPTLEECFAWGYTLSNGSTQDSHDSNGDELNEMVNDLFCDEFGLEDSIWTKARLETLHEFFIDAKASDFYKMSRLERLADKYPLEEFLIEMTDLIRNVWQISCEQIFDRPVLQQIEEGHIESLGVCAGDEFEEFCRRAGLTQNDFQSAEDAVRGEVLTLNEHFVRDRQTFIDES
jgi:hypothetical protein